MLNAIIRCALRYRLVVVVISLAVLGYGTYLSTQMPIDVFPDLDRPRVVILAECPGLAPEEVETLVTQPIETAVLGANGVQAVRSQSAPALTVIYVEFDWNTEVRAARQTVQERLTTVAGVMPEGVRPQMAPTTSIMGQFMVAGLYRQQGPQGGELAPVGKTGYLAELVQAPGQAEPHVFAWQATDRHQPGSWRPVKVDRLHWAPPRPTTDSPGERRAVLTIASRPHEVVFPSAAEQL